MCHTSSSANVFCKCHTCSSIDRESDVSTVSQSRWNSNDDNGNDSRHDNGNSGNSGNEDDDDNGNDDNSGNEDDDANRHSFCRDIFFHGHDLNPLKFPAVA